MAILPRPNPLSWRFKGTKGPSKTFTADLPALVEAIRESMREKAGIKSVPQLDVVLFLEGAPEKALADKAVVMPKAKLLVQRLSREDARKVISVANEEFERKAAASAAVAPSSGGEGMDGVGSVSALVGASAAALRGGGGIGFASSSTSGGGTAQSSSTAGSVVASGADGAPPTLSAALVEGSGAAVGAGTGVRGVVGGGAAMMGAVAGGTDGAAVRPAGPDSAEYEEEQLRINSLMTRQHDLFTTLSGAPLNGPESASQRYHRNKNFNMTWNPQEGERFGGALMGAAGSGTVVTVGGVVDHSRHGHHTNLLPLPGTHAQPANQSVEAGSSAATSSVLVGPGWGGKPLGSLLSIGAAGAPSFPGAGGTGQYNLAVRPDYVCHMCGEKGHHIKNCTRGHDAKFQKKVKPATGIPSNFLQDISADDIPLYSQVYIRKDGTFAVMKKSQQISSHAYFREDLDRRIESHLGSAAHLKCPLCTRIFKSPVVTPCCGDSFCRKCLYEALTTRAYGGRNKCPSCRQTINPAEIMSNKVLSDSVDAVFRGAVGVAATVLPPDINSASTTTATATRLHSTAVTAGGTVVDGTDATMARGVVIPRGITTTSLALQQQQPGLPPQAAVTPSHWGTAVSSASAAGAVVGASSVSSSRHVLAATSRNATWVQPPDSPKTMSSLTYATGAGHAVEQFGLQQQGLSGGAARSPENHLQKTTVAIRRGATSAAQSYQQDVAGAYIDQFFGVGARKRKAAAVGEGEEDNRNRYAKTANVASFPA